MVNLYYQNTGRHTMKIELYKSGEDIMCKIPGEEATPLMGLAMMF